MYMHMCVTKEFVVSGWIDDLIFAVCMCCDVRLRLLCGEFMAMYMVCICSNHAYIHVYIYIYIYMYIYIYIRD